MMHDVDRTACVTAPTGPTDQGIALVTGRDADHDRDDDRDDEIPGSTDRDGTDRDGTDRDGIDPDGAARGETARDHPPADDDRRRARVTAPDPRTTDRPASAVPPNTAPPAAHGVDGSPLPLHDDGLDRASTRLYLLAVRTPGLTRPRMVAAGIPADAVDPALGFLTRHGLLRPTDDDAWEAIPPELALSSLATSYETRAASLRDAADDLTHEYHRARLAAAEQSPGLTVLRNNDELASAVQGVTGAARQELWSAHDDSPRTAHLFGTDLDRHRQRLLTRGGTPLRRRTTFDGRMLRHPRAGVVLRARAEGGEESRFLSDLPFSIVGADDHSAVVDLTSFDTSGAGSLLVHDRRLVLALRRLCETWWQLASPMAREGMGELDRDGTFILSMLAAGATDATMAAQTGLSQRTVERRVRVLMTRLGATTRFQAGVLAARRGWI